MKKHGVRSFLGMLGLLAASFLPGGCDDPNTSELDGYFESHPFVNDPRSSSPSVVSINPSSATIASIGSRVVFRAAGGSGGYTWDVSTPSRGSITPSGGSQAIYVALSVGANDVIVYDRSGHAAIAYISGGEQQSGTLAIKAEPQTISTDWNLSVLTASGGTPPYAWAVSDSLRGNFPSGNTGASVIYQRYDSGDNAVTVTDGSGTSVSLIISQP